MKKTIILFLLGLGGLLFIMTSANADPYGNSAPASGNTPSTLNQTKTEKPATELDEQQRHMHRMRERRLRRRLARTHRVRLERRHRARVRRRMRRRERREHEGKLPADKAVGQAGSQQNAATPKPEAQDQH